METSKNTYIPGTCNIGPKEIQQRMAAGWIGLIATLVIGGVLFYLPITHWARLILFFPSAIGALGFLQSAFHFCVAFGMQGLFNMTEEAGKTESISQQEFRKQDKKKAVQIITYSVLIGVIVAIAAVYI